MFAPSPPVASSSLTATRASSSAATAHPRAPVHAHTARGTFPCEPITGDERATALDELEADVIGASTARVRASTWKTWRAFHCRWFGAGSEALPLTVSSIYAVAAQMKMAGYRSFPGYMSSAREAHVAAEHCWTESLERARRRSKASTQRGIGPARQSLEISPLQIAALRLGPEPLHEHGPVCPGHWAIVCSFHMLRGAESACALASSLRVDADMQQETFSLAATKTSGDRLPTHVGLRMWRDLRSTKRGLPLPLCASTQSGPCQKVRRRQRQSACRPPPVSDGCGRVVLAHGLRLHHRVIR